MMVVNVENQPSPGGMNIAHLNVASILGAHKFEMLRLQVQGSLLDVFCASETWLTKEVPNELVHIKGFNCARLDRSWRDNDNSVAPKKGGGLICYAGNKLDMNEFRYAHLNVSSKDLEMQWISIDSKVMRRIVVINVYRPPQGDYKEACKRIHTAINEADLKDNAEIFLMGDFNIDCMDKKSPMYRELASTVSYWDLGACISEATRLGCVQGSVKESCIDNIFTNSRVIEESRVLDWNFSDHLVVMVKRKRARVAREKISFKGRSYRNYVKEDFQAELLQVNWDKFYNNGDPDECWDFIEESIRVYLNRECPQKLFKVREIGELWVTPEIIEEIKDKDASLRRARRTGNSEDWERARRDRNRVGRLIESAKAEFLKEQQVDLADDPKKFWRLVKSIVPGKSAKKSKIVLVNKEDIEGDQNIDDSKVAEFINTFFSNIGPNLAKDLNDPWVFRDGREDPEGENEECPPFVTDFEQVMKLCREIKVCKSSGFGDISTRIFKDAFRVLVPQLVYLFNLAFNTGIFPSKWKSATIIPLYKGGDKTDVSNYRPVSLLPLPGKLIEKVVHSRITNYFDVHDIITDKQGGFRKGFSTASSIAYLTDVLFAEMNKGLTSLAVFVDLRKAFDTVNHGVLLAKLKCYGIKGVNLRWCENYLLDRKQRIEP